MKIGLSSMAKTLDERLFQDYQQAGIEVMELSLEREGYAALDDQKIKEWADRYGVELWSMHLPFAPFEEIDPSCEETKENAVSYFKELILRGVKMGIRRFVVHASGEPIADEDRAKRMKCAKESLRELAEFASQHEAVIAVEDLPRTCIGRDSAEIRELISVHDALYVCFDTNHLLSEDPAHFVRELGDKIITTHVSDYDFVDERHWLPGEGKIDWKALYQAFLEVGYQGAWLYEIAFSDGSVKRARDLCCADFVKNAKEIFSGKEPLPVE